MNWERQALGQGWDGTGHWDGLALGQAGTGMGMNWDGAGTGTGRHWGGDELGQGWALGWHWWQSWVPGGTAPHPALLSVSWLGVTPGDVPGALGHIHGDLGHGGVNYCFRQRLQLLTATGRSVLLPPSLVLNTKYFPFFSAFVKLVFLLI